MTKAGFFTVLLRCRDVSQSPWTIDGRKKGRTSVQEEIEKFLLPGLRCDGCKFITAGERSDVSHCDDHLSVIPLFVIAFWCANFLSSRWE